MNLEQQCVSLYLAKRLKELGVKQESLFYWADGSIVVTNDYDLLLNNGKVRTFSCVNNACPDQYISDLYSAFTIAEILEILPNRIILDNETEPYNSFRLRIEKSIIIKEMNDPQKLHQTEIYCINYYCDSTSQKMDWIFTPLTKNKSDENSANACANMLVYLLEKRMIKND